MSARHRKNRSSRRKAAALAVPMAATLLMSGATDHAAQSASHRTAYTDVDLAAISLIGVPGATYEERQPINLEWQNGGVWQQIADVTILGDKSRYSGEVSKASIDGGAAWMLEEILKRDSSATVIAIMGGSLGGRVVAQGLREALESGYDMRNIFAVLYNDSNTPDTGVFARFGQNQTVLGSDVTGGAVALPDQGTYLRVNREYDPIAYFPKYWLNPISVLHFVAAYVFEHPRLDNFDFSDPYNVTTVDGNVTTVRVNTPVMPLLMPFKLLGVPMPVIQALQEVMQPIVESTGIYEKGHVQALPSPQVMLRHLQAIIEGFGRAGQRLEAYANGQPYVESLPQSDQPTGPSTTEEIIGAIIDRDQEISGSTDVNDTEQPEELVTPVAERISLEQQPVESLEVMQTADVEESVEVAVTKDIESEGSEVKTEEAAAEQAKPTPPQRKVAKTSPRSVRTAKAPAPKKRESSSSSE